jgi:hypothetical protein
MLQSGFSMNSGWTVALQAAISVSEGCQSSKKILSHPDRRFARVAQLVEQRTENPRVGGSSPPPGTTFQVQRSVDRGSSS